MQIPDAQKRQSSQQCRLALLGPTSVKAVRKTLVKLTPGGEIDEATFPFQAHYVSSIYLLDQTLTYVYDRPYNIRPYN